MRYGPKLLGNGASVEEVIASEDEVRTPALDVPLRLMDGLIRQGYPVIFTGDHNEPSSLDWTDATATAMGNPWPLPPGRYVVHYLVTDRYRSIGNASFEVAS